MSFGGSSPISTTEPKIGALSYQNSAYGLPVALMWGTARLSGNLIWYGDFTATAHTSSEASGGKGGGGVNSENTTYTYTTAFMLGLCEGEVSAIGRVWQDKEKTTFTDLGMTLLPGSMSQAAWTHLATQHPSEALAYPGIAIAAHSAFDLGGSAHQPNLSFEVSGPRQFGSGIVDARPDEIITDLLTHAIYGAGFPAARLSVAAYRTYTQAQGLFLSPVISTQQSAAQHLEELLRATNSAPLWSDGLLKIIPYADTTVDGNGATYVPAITSQADLTDDDFIISGSEPPIVIRRKPAADAYNHVQVEFRNRVTDYNIEIAEAKDLGSISAYGLRTMEPVRLHAICGALAGNKIAQLLLQRSLYIRNEYEFTLGWQHCLLEPMDVVTLTHAPLGLVLFKVRIKEITEDESGLLRVIAEEFPDGVATPAETLTQSSGGYTMNTNVAPGNANAPVLFEPPLALSINPELWLATSGGATWGGAEVWVSLDDATYKLAGVTTGSARHGVLTAVLPSAVDPDITSTLALDLTVSGGTLIGGSIADRDLFLTLCYVDGELISFKNAALTAPSKYSLTDLRRGAYGSLIGSHAIGSKFARLDQAIFRYAYDPEMVGKTIYIKLRSFNVHNLAHQELYAVPAIMHVIGGAPVGSVSGLALAQPWVGTTLSVVWTPYAGAANYRVEVWVGGLLKRTADNIAACAFDYTLEMNLADGGPYRAVELRVYAKHATGTSTNPAILSASNPQIGAPTGVSVEGTVGQINIQADMPTDSDYAGTIMWAGDAAGFALDDLHKIYDGPAPVFGYIVAGGTTKHIRLAHYDKLGRDSLNASSDMVATSILAGGVPVVSVQPGAVYLGDDVVFYDVDGKLYTWTGTAYTKAVDAADIVGQLADGQIAALAAAKITGTLSDAQLAAIAAAKITGTIAGTQITNGAISTAKLAAGAVTAAVIAADTITAAQIAAGAVTATELAAGSVSTAKLVAGAITATELAAGSVTATKVAAASINSAAIIAGAVTTDKMYAATLSAITANLGTITAGNMTLDASGYIKGGSLGWLSGTGFWMGYNAGAYKFYFGNPSGAYMGWDGTNILVSGEVIAQPRFAEATNVVTVSSGVELLLLTLPSITTGGADPSVMLSLDCRFTLGTGGSESWPTSSIFRIKRGATLVKEITVLGAGMSNFTGDYVDESVTAGTYTYYVYVLTSGGTLVSTARRSCTMLGVKK